MAKKYTIQELVEIAKYARTYSSDSWIADLKNQGPGRVLATDPRQTIICESSGSSQNSSVQADMIFIATFNPKRVVKLLEICEAFIKQHPNSRDAFEIELSKE